MLPIFGERKKCKLYILKKVGLSSFKEILKKYVYNSTVMSSTYFYFFWNGTLDLKMKKESSYSLVEKIICLLNLKLLKQAYKFKFAS